MRNWIVFAALLLASCSESPSQPGPEEAERTPVATAEFSGLRQSVYLSRPVEVDRLLVFESHLENIGSQAVAVRARGHGLTFDGIPFEDSELFGAPKAIDVVLEPGEELRTGDLRRLSSGQGSYEVRVHHSLDPEGVASFEVLVP
jgi:hypothetical protein